MNFHFPFFHKPSPQPLRAIVATRSESAKVAAKREKTTAELRAFVNRKAGERALEAVAAALREQAVRG